MDSNNKDQELAEAAGVESSRPFVRRLCDRLLVEGQVERRSCDSLHRAKTAIAVGIILTYGTK